MSAPVAGSARPPTNNNKQSNHTSAVLDHPFFNQRKSSQPSPKGHDEETFHLSDSPRRDVIATKPKYEFNACARFCFIPIRHPRTLNAEPSGSRHGLRRTDLLLSIFLKPNSVFFFILFYFFRVSWTRVGCVVVSFAAQHLFLIPPVLCCFWLGGRRKMWDMGYEDEHLLVRHYPWVNNPLRAWAQCRRPQELITFFWTGKRAVA
ncbi:hypothetical protein F5144DRAFT_221667 [Chaetomium tenue]|uniref:Uncharacterized protein n=1 Tax=Chaetomium tenue TaxID=1854479 RepID=A0ACB7P5G5_9PEZI|nr:hypothetical protein F5144DRAFT_221667 [Chaetomium globosum]